MTSSKGGWVDSVTMVMGTPLEDAILKNTTKCLSEGRRKPALPVHLVENRTAER